jgi:hypothetical protein
VRGLIALAGAMMSAACSGASGTLSVSLATAPGSPILDAVQTLRLVLTQPHTVVTQQRTSSGFDLALAVPAMGQAGQLIVDGLDASGNLVATGASPPFSVGAIDAKIVVYMAAPLSIAVAPAALSVARAQLGTGPLDYGAIVAGGADATGAPSAVVEVYDAYAHSLVTATPLPAARTGVALGVGANGFVYFYGGLDSTGAPTANLWRLDTTVAPSGSYADLGVKTGFERAGAIAAPLGGDMFVITGMPTLVLAGLSAMVAAHTEIAPLEPEGASVLASDGIATAIFASSSYGVVRARGGVFDSATVANLPASGHAVAALPGGKVVVACGGANFPDAIRIDAATLATDTIANVPSVPRTGCAVVATARHLVIAGGTLADGTVTARAEVYDATTLAPLALPSLAIARTGATAITLPNNQILIVGGVDGSGAPIATLELFTPDPLE